MFRRILVPLDGSLLAEDALEIATDIAVRLNGELILVHVIEDVMIPVPEAVHSVSTPRLVTTLERNYRNEATSYLHDIRQRICADGLAVESRVVEGNVAEAIINIAKKDVDLIIMTSHGETGLTRWLLGSVTEKVVGHAPCPVLVVKGKRPLTNFLVPLDGSALSESAVPPAIELAEAFDGQVTCLNVIEPPVDVSNSLISRLGMIDDELERWLKERNLSHAREYFESVAKRYSSQVDVPFNMVMKKATPVEGIVSYAEKVDIDLIVISTHGRAGLVKWLLGSVTERVLKQASCHVLVIRPLL